MKGIYLILGSNLGNKYLSIKKAIDLIRERIGTVEKKSSFYDTEPWGFEKQPNYLNQVIEINTKLLPTELLQQINRIEVELGRVRNEKWRERILDIDILYYHDKILKNDEIEIPHSQIPNRNFVLIPLCEIASEEVHPITGKTQKQMLDECPDTLNVVKVIEKHEN